MPIGYRGARLYFASRDRITSLRELRSRKPLSIREIVEIIGESHSSVARYIKMLEE